MTIPEKIDSIEAAIFEFEIGDVTNSVVNIFTEIIETGAIDTRDPAVLNGLNGTMGSCLAAMQRRDYLMLADQLEYVLKPMLAESGSTAGIGNAASIGNAANGGNAAKDGRSANAAGTKKSGKRGRA